MPIEPTLTDCDLLRRYTEQGDEAAFAEVVRRYADLVYSVAWRVTCQTALAQDVTQAVFTKLAQEARKLRQYEMLVGWLHTTTRHTAINAVRGEVRRRAREEQSVFMQTIATAPEANWEQLRPILDEAVDQLRARDRQAVLLRFFRGLSHAEVGAVLGLNEEAARKCGDRALEKLRVYFARRGVTVSSTLLATAMSANSVQAAPVGLAENVAKTSLVGASSGATASGIALLLAFFMNTKTKVILALVVLILLVGGSTWWLMQPAATAPVKTADASAPVKAAAPKPVAPVASISAPIADAMPTAPTPASVPLAASQPLTALLTNSHAESRAELDTAFKDMGRMYREGDTAAFIRTYTEPDKLDPELLKRVQANQDAVKNIPAGEPGMSQTNSFLQLVRERTAKSFEDLVGQTPTFNAAGDEATYQFMEPGYGPDGPTASTPSTRTFIKINGQWYLKKDPPAAAPAAAPASAMWRTGLPAAAQ